MRWIFYLPLLPAILIASPKGEKVAHGACSFERSSNSLTIHQKSDKAIIDWQDFSISNGETTRILQPSEVSSILNRVVSNRPSEIHGTLQSNGQVYLINQNGILIGPEGKIQTNGFVASALNLSNAEFLGGEKMTFSGENTAGVINQGAIESFKGDVFLIAHDVVNEGTISAKNGTAGLGVGSEVMLVPEENRRIAILVRGNGSLSQEGLIESVQAELIASGGDAHALAINMGGTIQVTEREGHIFIEAIDGTTQVDGQMTASNGGTIHVLGSEVHLKESAMLDASGDLGGGRILVGGDYQGSNPNIQNAQVTYVDKGASVKADSLLLGDGGTIIFWGDHVCHFEGSASARGGQISGNGGLIEVSSPFGLAYKGQVDTKAPFGKAGMLLLDPVNITIINSAGPSAPVFPTTAGPPTDFYEPASNATLADDNVQTALVGGNNVTIRTSGGATGVGTVTVNTGAAITWATATTLTIEADRNIQVDSGATFTSQNASGNFTAMDFTATGGTAATHDGISITGTLTSADGNINLTGTGGDSGSSNVGVHISPAGSAGTVETTGAGNLSITATGKGNSGGVGNRGFRINANGDVQCTGTGDLAIIGLGGNGTAANEGIISTGGTISQTGSGSLTITGTAGSGSATDSMELNTVTISSSGGDISLIALASSSPSGASNMGINSSATIFATGSAGITISVAGNTGTTNNHGVNLHTAGGITSANGDIEITATAMDPGVGIRIGRAISSSGTGSITITGTGNASNGIEVTASINAVTTASGSIILTGDGAVDVQHTNGSLLASSTSGDITINANTMNISGTGDKLASSGALIIQPRTAATTIGLGTGATGTLNLDTTELGKITNGFSSITIGKSDGTGAVDVQAHTFNDPVTIRGGPITVSGALATGGADKLSLFSSGAISATASVTAGGDLQVGPQVATDTFGIGSAATGTTSINDTSIANLSIGGALTFGRSLADSPDNVIDFDSTQTFSRPVSIYGRSLSVNDSLTTSTGALDLRIATGASDGAFTLASGQSLSSGTTTSIIGELAARNATFTFNAANSTVDTLTGTASGTNSLSVSSGTNSWGITSSNAGTLTDSATITFTSIQNLTGGTSNDTFTFSDAAGITGALNGGSGGTNTLDLSAYSTAVTVNVATSTATGVGGGFSNLSSFIGPAGTVNSFLGPNASNWNITSDDTGTVSGTSFSNFANLTGGTLNDTFAFADGVKITGDLNGGSGGTNTLDLSAYTTPVTVDLATSTSPGVDGTFSNIQNVVGAVGQDNTLLGPNTTTWTITGVNSGTVNGTSFSNFPNITGGTSDDLFIFTLTGFLDGMLDGGPGVNELDFDVLFTSPVTSYNPATGCGTATNILGGFCNIQIVVFIPVLAARNTIGREFSTQFDLSMLFLNESRRGVFWRFQDLLSRPTSFSEIYWYFGKVTETIDNYSKKT